MTTHLEYYSEPQRMAQARALRELHLQACCAHAAAPPEPLDDGSPFQTKLHTANAILCGDFNLQPHEPEYALIQQPFAARTALGQLAPAAWRGAASAYFPSVRPRIWA